MIKKYIIFMAVCFFFQDLISQIYVILSKLDQMKFNYIPYCSKYFWSLNSAFPMTIHQTKFTLLLQFLKINFISIESQNIMQYYLAKMFYTICLHHTKVQNERISTTYLSFFLNHLLEFFPFLILWVNIFNIPCLHSTYIHKNWENII